jgi:hypothetical protein
MKKYAVPRELVLALLASGECATEEEALEKVASGAIGAPKAGDEVKEEKDAKDG